MKSTEIKRQFKQLPNYQPVSQLFDANHLDLFIKKHDYIKKVGTPLGVSVKRSEFLTQSVDKLSIAKEYAQN
jgi:hypothetical protein